MSSGTIIGGVAGGVIGGVIGCFTPIGPFYGAYLGFTIGAGIGGIIDPITPDINTPGKPASQKLDIMTNEVGIPIPDILGTAKLSGNLLWFGNERSVEVTETQSVGGKGGGSSSTTVTTGYKYYMSWAMGICLGPVDGLIAIYKDNEIIWGRPSSGYLARPGSGGQETVPLTGSDQGTIIFYYGTSDQVANSNMGTHMDDSTLNVPYRNLCWVYFQDYLIGDYNRMPQMSFVVYKSPTCSFDSGDTYSAINTLDYNPVHAIWYILTEMAGLSASRLNTATFLAVAATIHTEGRGISMNMNSAQEITTYIQSILAHIRGIVKYSSDGTFHPVLIRNDYTVGSLPTVNEDILLEPPTITRKAWIDTANQIEIQYSERTDQYNPSMNAAWDSVNSPTTITPSTSETVYITGGAPPFTWTIDTGGISGTGFTLANATTTVRNNTLIAASGACGTAGIKVNCTKCGGEVSGYVKSTVGVWTTCAEWKVNCYYRIALDTCEFTVEDGAFRGVFTACYKNSIAPKVTPIVVCSLDSAANLPATTIGEDCRLSTSLCRHGGQENEDYGCQNICEAYAQYWGCA